MSGEDIKQVNTYSKKTAFSPSSSSLLLHCPLETENAMRNGGHTFPESYQSSSAFPKKKAGNSSSNAARKGIPSVARPKGKRNMLKRLTSQPDNKLVSQRKMQDILTKTLTEAAEGGVPHNLHVKKRRRKTSSNAVGDTSLQNPKSLLVINESTKEVLHSSQNDMLGAAMKIDLGELLRRSCRERKSSARFGKASLSTSSKDSDELNKKLYSCLKNVANSRPYLQTGAEVITIPQAPTRTITEPFVKRFLFCPSSKESDSAPPASPAPSSVATNEGACAVNLTSNCSSSSELSCQIPGVFKRVKRRFRYFKGSTYALSLHGRSAKKKKSDADLGKRISNMTNGSMTEQSEMQAPSEMAGMKVNIKNAKVVVDRVNFGQKRRAKARKGASGIPLAADSAQATASHSQCQVAASQTQDVQRDSRKNEMPTSDFANEELEEEGDDGFEIGVHRRRKSKGIDLKSPLELCRLNGIGKRSHASVMEVAGTLKNNVEHLTVLEEKQQSKGIDSSEIVPPHRGKRRKESWKETAVVSTSSDSEGNNGEKKKRKKGGNNSVDLWNTPLSFPFITNGDKKHVTTITVQQAEYILQGHPLCTCKTQEGSHRVPERIGTYCEGIDCIDSRLIGCVNVVSSAELLRPSVRVPFLALCEVHRQRLRFHQCCPGCGLFCTQGNFLQCRCDPRKAVHHAHKECVLLNDGLDLCPHCGEGSSLQEVTLELNAPRLPAFFQKQQESLRKEPGARMAFSRGGDAISNFGTTEKPVPEKFCKVTDNGKEISTAGLPIGPDRTQLENLLVNLSNERQTSTLRYTAKNMQAAVKSGDVEKVLQMLMMGFDPNSKFEDLQNSTVLHLAAANGHLILVHVLVQAGASLDAMDSLLQTPVMLSIDNGHTLVSQYLVKAGSSLDARGEDGMTALHLAAKAGQLEICRMILDTGKVTVNIHDDGGWTPLVWSAEHRHLPVVKFLLERGSDPNLRDNEHNIALHWSAFSGSLEISEIFLNHGCDLNSVNEHGDTPLHVAARQDRYECVMLLLARNASVDTVNKENETPIMCCPDPSSQTWLALSMTNHLKKISNNRTTRSEVILHRDITRGKEQNPVQCVNREDDEAAPSDFIYIRENCETLPINIDRSIASLQSCRCEDDCSSQNCTCGTMSLKCWYDKEGKLVQEFNLTDPPMIFECNRACFCWNTCNNRVIQHGITCRLQLFRTVGKGWGVKALRDIPRGTFICEYVGELISDLEADQREDDSYLFDLDNRDGETFCIDARRYGNISRFINHSCEPNLVPVKMFVDYQDLRFPRIALFSSRPIKAYEELGFDYGDKFWIIKYKSFTCTCGTEKCKYSVDSIQETLANYNRRLTEEQS